MKNVYLIVILSLIGMKANAQFGSPEIVDSTITQTVINIITADLNNDGKKDIITSHYQNQINWYNNLGGSFSSEQIITTNISHPFHLDVGDANGDGSIDVLATDNNGNSSQVVLFLNNSNGTSWSQIVIDSAIQVTAVKSFFVDIDNDGDLDIITNTDLEITMYINLGFDNFTNRIVVADTNEFYNITVNDFNNDNYADFAVHSAHGLQLYLNNSNATFNLADTIDPDLNGFITSVDVDNDNDIDIISGSSTLNFYNIFKNDGTGIFSIFASTQINCADNQNDPFISANLNSDLLKDALYVSNFDHNIYLKQNNGSGNFINPIILDNTYYYVNVYAEDIDNDSDNDIIWYAHNSGVRLLGTIQNNNPILGINEELNDKFATIIPNPAKEMITIQAHLDAFEIDIYNMFGQIVLKSNVKNINISDLTRGVYFITIKSSGNNNCSIKLIKE
jgi:hypothetical protein